MVSIPRKSRYLPVFPTRAQGFSSYSRILPALTPPRTGSCIFGHFRILWRAEALRARFGVA